MIGQGKPHTSPKSSLSDQPIFNLDKHLKSVRQTNDVTDNSRGEQTEYWVLRWKWKENWKKKI